MSVWQEYNWHTPDGLHRASRKVAMLSDGIRLYPIAPSYVALDPPRPAFAPRTVPAVWVAEDGKRYTQELIEGNEDIEPIGAPTAVSEPESTVG